MKKFFTLLLLLSQIKSFATHLAGAELIYSLVPGTTNSYIFTYKLYADCGIGGVTNAPAPFSVNLCYKDTCIDSTWGISLSKVAGILPTVPPDTNGSILYNPCSAITTCNSINSTIHGYKQWWYHDTVVLPYSCNAWKFWVTLCCRNGAVENITAPAGTQYLHVETTFDNTVHYLNSSPAFQYAKTYSKTPVPLPLVNMPYVHDGGVLDMDGDSLVIETTFPLHTSGCNGFNPNNILLPFFNILDTAGNPFPTQNTYYLNKQNAHFGFVLSQMGYYNLAQKVYEYRNGQLIGYSMRDMQIKPDFVGDFDYDSIHVCLGATYTFPDGFVLNNIQSDTFHYSMFTTVNGCDSLILTLLDAVDFPTTLTQNGNILTSDESDSNATYQWIQCNPTVVLTGDTLQSITALPGIAYAVIMTKYGCSDTSQCVQLQNPSGTNTVKHEDLVVFPNPATSELVVSGIFSDLANLEVKLFNPLGQLVYRTQNHTPKDSQIKINVSQFPKGIYYLQVDNIRKKVILK